MLKLVLSFLTLVCLNPAQSQAQVLKFENTVIREGELPLDFNNLWQDAWFDQKPIANFEMAPGELALTIDDGPSIYTDGVLDVLANYGIRATFFLNGGKITERLLPIMEKMARAGHNIANHTHHHLFDFKSADQMYREILNTDRAIAPYMAQSGTRRKYVRTPGGVWNTWRADALNSHRELVSYIGHIHWDIGGDPNQWRGGELLRASDWQCWSKGVNIEACAWAYYLQTIAEGSGVILMHDIRSQAPRFLETYLGYLVRFGRDGKGNGQWKFKVLDELPVLDQYEI